MRMIDRRMAETQCQSSILRTDPVAKICRFLWKVRNDAIKRISDTSAVVKQGADPQFVNKALRDAGHGADQMTLGTRETRICRGYLSSTPQDIRRCDRDDRRGTSYAKLALCVLSCASKIILAQAHHDEAILDLYKKSGQAYGFMTQDDTPLKISSMRIIFGQISADPRMRQLHQGSCGAEISLGELRKNIISETNDMIQQCNEVLDALNQNFRGQVARDISIYIHREILEFNAMAYAEAAGLDTGKRWLSGTDAHGHSLQYRTGKSAIAHTIAGLFIRVGGLGSCYYFHRNTNDCYQKVFTTIARDLADRHPEMRRVLADAVKNETALKTTANVVQQWQKFLVEPLGKLSESPMGPVVIVIDALDKSGEAVETRKLPKNFRFIVISRPLRDIQNSFASAQHIQRIYMDGILPEVVERDICAYVSKTLEGLSYFGSNESTALIKKAVGLFEWARLACESI
ncbi:hypothetical protein EV424DRAFT_1643935 [Suillus variegatus]|nr:hypothetical protein EV424DRAFT_1643935 [Suillus variegatus]